MRHRMRSAVLALVVVGGTSIGGMLGGVAATTASPTPAGAAATGWTVSTSSSTTVTFDAISCASASTCEAIGEGNGPTGGPVIMGTTDGGSTWSSQTSLGNGAIFLTGISCASTTVCEAVGYDLNPMYAETDIFGTTDGGATWTEQSSAIAPAAPSGISCASTTTCEISTDTNQILGTTGPYVLRTTDGGTSWTTQQVQLAGTQVDTGSAEITGLSCPSPTTCEAVASSTNPGTPTTEAIIGTTDGTTWAVQTTLSSGQALADISCASTTICEAVGSNGSGGPVILATSDGGTSWVSQSAPSGTYQLTAVSCGTTVTCEAVGDDSTGSAVGIGTTDGGSTWASQTMPTGVGLLNGVSCPSAVTCFSAGAASNTATANAQILSYSGPPPPPTTSMLFPANGATISEGTWLDAGAQSPVGLASVTFEVSGGPNAISDQAVGSGAATLIGWLGGWNTTTVPNGTYTIQSVATDVDGVSTTSAPLTVTVNNPPPSTTVVAPSAGATQSGTSANLDATSTGDVTAISYELSGETLTNQVIATGTLTLYGWEAQWNTTTVPNGTYTIQSVGTVAGGSTVTSAPITITVNNGPPSTTMVSWPSVLDAVNGFTLEAVASPGATSVSFDVGPGLGSFAATPTTNNDWVASGGGGSCTLPITGTPCSTGEISITIQSVATYPDGETATSPAVNAEAIVYCGTPVECV